MSRPGVISVFLLLLACSLHAQGLWETFSNDYTANCLAWTREKDNPVIAPSGSSWKSRWTANPELVTINDRILLYYAGNGTTPRTLNKAYHHRIGVAEITSIGAMQLTFHDLNNGFPVIDIGAPGNFDDEDVCEPAVVSFKGEVLLYYTGTSKGRSSIGCAKSLNGERFTKVGKVFDGRFPDVVAVRDTLYLFYQKNDSAGYKVYVAISVDGMRFYPLGESAVFEGERDKWDAKSIVSPRVWKQGDWYYMLYGASADRVDEPEFFGLARSRNLVRWERHPGNPIFSAGAHATADGGAIWYPACYDAGSWFVLLYQGSRGRAAWDLSPGICIAWIPKR
jgi:predicted GH43/DUF377 family glycosyl hydrolase